MINRQELYQFFQYKNIPILNSDKMLLDYLVNRVSYLYNETMTIHPDDTTFLYDICSELRKVKVNERKLNQWFFDINQETLLFDTLFLSKWLRKNALRKIREERKRKRYLFWSLTYPQFHLVSSMYKLDSKKPAKITIVKNLDITSFIYLPYYIELSKKDFNEFKPKWKKILNKNKYKTRLEQIKEQIKNKYDDKLVWIYMWKFLTDTDQRNLWPWMNTSPLILIISYEKDNLIKI